MTPSAKTIVQLAAGPVLALLLSACAHQAVHLDEVGAPQVPLTTSVEEADAKLKVAASEREAAEATFAAREQECYTRFFVNNCLDKAKEQRRVTLVRLRAVEAEANHFKRAESVRLRDLELARTQEDARVDLEQRTAATPTPLKVVTPPSQPAAPAGKSLAQRQAEHDAKLKKEAAQEAADAPRRTASEADFARKQAEAAKRQARVAQRLAERQADAAAKAAKAAAAASAPPPPMPEN
ncbi:hypothetical protein [Janthinobacterium aquaticum]|uniref:hypothetical protein n=1 Tax=Janthinobacterium sp. FT58W TaxID=2654254 RepID=UPI0012648E4F|nr:hypothetical protein [Janthinobacterium sp. FT58W]KAB8042489.1 hypothetical protein GCM43_13250 [Janthinobacterium sp. FT58W]